jgi:Skp family chaperone for outer membrane proteins
MKTLRLIAAMLFLAAIFTVSATAQTSASGDKIGLVNWAAFTDEKAGITKFSAALTALAKEFDPPYKEIQAMAAKYNTLKTELEGYQKLRNENKPIPVAETELQKKLDQLQQIGRDVKFKQDDAKARYQSRYVLLVGPVETDILKALNEFATQKGYAVILDGAKLEQGGILLGLNQKADVTKDFITYYNARPATTATVTKK